MDSAETHLSSGSLSLDFGGAGKYVAALPLRCGMTFAFFSKTDLFFYNMCSTL